MVAILCALTEVELYGYCWGQMVDIHPMMLVAQFQVMEEGGDYQVQHSDTQSTNPPMDTDPEVGDEREDGAGRQTGPGDAAERDQWWHPWNWEAAMEEAKGLAYDDPWSDSDAMVTGADGSQGPELSLCNKPIDSPPNTPRSLALHMLGLPMEHMHH